MYLVRGTRPDIANAVRDLSKYLSCYNKTHFRVAQRVLKYLKGTSKYGIEYNGNNTINVRLYTDPRFANASEERKSITGYFIITCWCMNNVEKY
ncbi:polyprotein [Phytophthora megakarya]|uniref:Polyprotein n=1 Tax=Phytophthora megakarya TaxID=4795 RepID=A0A225VPZ6_9STRA|nr:polyprotein [Phytophthora megakarya]